MFHFSYLIFCLLAFVPGWFHQPSFSEPENIYTCKYFTDETPWETIVLIELDLHACMIFFSSVLIEHFLMLGFPFFFINAQSSLAHWFHLGTVFLKSLKTIIFNRNQLWPFFESRLSLSQVLKVPNKLGAV